VKVESSRLSIRSMLRTRSISYTDLASAETVTRLIGMCERVCVRLHMATGSHLDVTSLNEATASPQAIDEMASLIDERIKMGQGAQ